MRYELAKALRRRFTVRLRGALPQFRERKARSGVRGVHLYEWRPGPQGSGYVALAVDALRDRFTVDVAWSEGHHFPAQLRQASPDEGLRGGAARFQLRAFWQRYRVEPWWSLVPKSPYEQELDRALIAPEVPVARKVRLLEEYEASLAPALADQAALAVDPLTDALARIEPALDDVMERLREYAEPWFERQARSTRCETASGR
ncbi:MAG TPA: hypothetical protein VKA84_06310 [Gemmatimonadaceae bacterium]|nr:hypothetical protein [Gemmatimonadaceae bacterium]